MLLRSGLSTAAILSLDLQQVLFAFVVLSIFFLAARWLYRLTLHPLAKFPGPRLAAMSSLLAMYHDIPRGSSYIKKFPAWHDRYGPIIRIEPNHLHIRDIDAYNQIFCIGTKFNKDPKVYNLALSEGSFANNLVTRQVKGHRVLYSPHFSRGNVQAGEFVVEQYLHKFMDKLDTMDGSIDLTLGYRALCADIVSRYVLGKPFGALDGTDFSNPMLDFMQDSLGSPSFTFGWYLPNINKQMHKMARRFPKFFARISKPIRAIFYQMDFCYHRVPELRQEDALDGLDKPCVLETALHSDEKKGHPTLNDTIIGRDGWITFFAGTDLPATTLCYGTWHLLNNPSYLKRLRFELQYFRRSRSAAYMGYHDLPPLNDLSPTNAPAMLSIMSWQELEKLPFLRAVVKESLRLSGFLGKAPRVVPEGGVILCGEHIPSGTIVSCAAYADHHNPEYFGADHAIFNPDRWLGNERHLDRYWFPFGRGSRDCIGQNLGLAMLYLGFAAIFSRFSLELCDTTEDDMEWHDAMMTIKSRGHLKVKVRRCA